MDKKTIIIIASVAAVVLVVAAVVCWINFKKFKPSDFGGAEDITGGATRGTVPSINTNPLENKPDLNPVDKTNPFATIKINPF